jgi:hypothetical protein
LRLRDRLVTPFAFLRPGGLFTPVLGFAPPLLLFEIQGRFPRGVRSRCDRNRNAEHMVEVAVRQEDPVEPSEACAAQQQLTLGTLAAIDQDAVTSCLDEKSRVVAFG